MRVKGRIGTPLVVAAALVILTCAYTWPLVMHLRSTVAHDRGDPLLVTWILWWSTRAMPLTQQWWNAPAFYPSTGVFAFSESLLSLAPITAPILAVTTTPLVAYNAAFLLTFVLSGLGAYFLAYVLTSRHDAAVVAAIAFAFAPYRLSHLNHIQLLSSYWMPVSLASLHLYLRGGRAWTAALFAGAWLMQALASGYYLFFLSLLVALWLAWFGPRHLSRRQLTVLAASWMAAGVLMIPLLLGYRAVHERYGMKRSPVEIEYYSADIAGVVSASADSLLWNRLHAVDKIESEIFPGLTIGILAAAGLWMITRGRAKSVSSDRSALVFYLGAAALMWLLALGPRPAYLGRPIGVPGPYAVLMHLPGFDEMRVPARLWMLAVLCLSAASALTVARIPTPAIRRWCAPLAIAGLLIDGWPGSFQLAAAPELRPPHRTSAVARLGLPLVNNETESMYRTIGDDLPVFNGYSGYEAPQHPALRDLLNRRDPAILDLLAAGGPIQIVVEHDLDPDRSWRTYVERSGATLLDTGTDWSRYELPRRRSAIQGPASGSAVRVEHVDVSVNQKDINAIFDGDLLTRWHSATQRGDETLTLDLGAPHHVRWLELCLGTYSSQYPRSIVAEASTDGVAWSAAWSGRTALATYAAAVDNPRVVPVRIPIDREARWLRLRQVAREDTRGWTIVELRVLE